MKGLHVITPRTRYAEIPLLTTDMLDEFGGERLGYLVDRWAEGRYPMALWRSGRADGNYYLIYNHDDQYYADQEEKYVLAQAQGMRNAPERPQQWWVTASYCPNPEKRTGAIIGLPEFSLEELVKHPMTRECTHNFDRGYGYCQWCNVDDPNRDGEGEPCEYGHDWSDDGYCTVCNTERET